MLDVNRYIVHGYPLDINQDSVLVDKISQKTVEGREYFIINDPAYIETVLTNRDGLYIKSQASNNILKPAIGEGVLTSDGAKWRRQRKVIMQGFTKKSLDYYSNTIAQYCENFIAEVDEILIEKDEVEIHEITTRVALQLIAQIVMSLKLDSNDVKTMIDLEKNLLVGAPSLTETTAGKTRDDSKVFHEHLAEFEKFIYGVINERKASSESKNDVLQLLVDDQRKNPEVDDVELRDQVITLFTAGHETCANVISWAFYSLVKNPEVIEKLHAEIDNIGRIGDLTPKDIHHLQLPTQIFKEALRLFPPVHLVYRESTADTMLGDTKIPAGSEVTVSPWVTHRNSLYWQDPFVFKPERFANDGDRQSYTYIPFGGGSRICLGQGFALREGPVIIAAIAKHYDLALGTNRKIQAYGGVTLRPRYGINMTLTKR